MHDLGRTFSGSYELHDVLVATPSPPYTGRPCSLGVAAALGASVWSPCSSVSR